MTTAARSAIITGGSAGLGLAISQMLADEGWNLTIVARDPAKLQEAAQDLVQRGADVLQMPVNLADASQTPHISETHTRRFGGLDMLVNNAGVGFVGPMETKTRKQLDLELSLNFRTAYLLLQSSIPELKASAARHGASYVVNVSSLVAKTSPPNGSTYAATKAALVSLSNAAHAELSSSGVHVTALLPGFVDTPGTAWADSAVREEMLLPSDVAEAVRFLTRTSARCFIPEVMMTTAGPGVWHSPIDWATAST